MRKIQTSGILTQIPAVFVTTLGNYNRNPNSVDLDQRSCLFQAGY